MAQSIIGTYRAVKAGKPTVIIEPIFFNLASQIVAPLFNHLGQIVFLPFIIDNPVAGTAAAMFNEFGTATIAKHRSRFKTP